MALRGTELLRLSRAACDELVKQDSLVAYKLALNSVEQIADYLHVAIDWIMELVTKKAPNPQSANGAPSAIWFFVNCEGYSITTDTTAQANKRS